MQTRPKKDWILMNNPGIVIITWNHVNFTKLCLEYIFKYTSSKVPILVVDNGSGQETIDYLKSIENRISVIYNKTNRGIAPALNQGIDWCLERGLDFCFVSNDIVVGRDWLKNLQVGVYKHEKIGAGSPFISPEFCYDEFCNLSFRERYRHNIWPLLKNDPTVYELKQLLNQVHEGDFDDFTKIWSLTRKNIPPYFEWGSMVMYIKKSTIEKIGKFDERFIPSNWEDMDYMVRCNNAGLYRVAVTDSYVFHWSNISNRNSFFDAPESYRKEMSENEKRFQDKWRIFKPHNERNHSVKDGDKYEPKKRGPKLDQFFEVSDKVNSREHDEWYTWEEYNKIQENK
jgi:GT2 family glycosyltransferase